MIKVLSFLIFASISFNLFSQIDGFSKVVQPDSRLSTVFSQNYLDKVAQENPVLLSKWNFYLDNAFFITDFPAGKKDEGVFESIKVEDVYNINIKKLEKELGIGPDYENQRIYKIAGTNKLLIYRSGKDFYRLYNKHTGS